MPDLDDRTTAERARDHEIYEAFRLGEASVTQLAERHGLTHGAIARIISKRGRQPDDQAEAAAADFAGTVAVHELPADVVAVPQHVRDAYITPGALDLIRKGVPENTWLAYRKQLIMFGDWCAAEERTAAPVSEATMLSYLDHLRSLPMPGTAGRRAEDGTLRRFRPAPSTTWIWYSAVKFIHGIGTPPIPWEPAKKLALAMAGYETEMLELGWTPKSAPRAYPDDVRRMVARCDRETSTGRRDAAILLLGWHTAARASDLANYRLRDMVRTPKGLDLTLRKSKTLKPGQKRTTAVFLNEDNPERCPVRAALLWLDWLTANNEADPTWALFRPLDRYGRRLRVTSRGPNYRLDSTSLTQVVQKYALLAGLSGELTMHSLRRGYATWLRELGYDPLSIARAYGWAPGGSINVYLEEADRWDEKAPGSSAFL